MARTTSPKPRRKAKAAANDSALPLLSVRQAAHMLGISSNLAYELIRADKWPTPVLHVGRMIKIPPGAVIALLAGDQLPTR